MYALIIVTQIQLATVYDINSTNITESFAYDIKPIRDQELHEQKLRRRRRDINTGYESAHHIDNDYLKSRLNPHQVQKRTIASADKQHIAKMTDFPMDYLFLSGEKGAHDYVRYVNETSTDNTHHRSK